MGIEANSITDVSVTFNKIHDVIPCVFASVVTTTEDSIGIPTIRVNKVTSSGFIIGLANLSPSGRSPEKVFWLAIFKK